VVLALLTEEQQMLRDMAVQLAASTGVTNPQDLETVDRAKGWQSLAESGLLSLRVRDGGAPTASGVEVMLATEALAGALAPQPFVGATLAIELLSLAGAPQEWIDEIANGESRTTLLLSRDLSGLAKVDDLGSAVAWDAEEAAYGLALSGKASAPQVVRVPLGTGFTELTSADLTRVVLGAKGKAGSPENAGKPLTAEQYTRWLTLAYTTVAADTVGVIRSALLGAVEYTKERIAYGVLIGTFQALQHMCAEAFVKVEAASSAVKYAAWGVDELDPDEALLAARTAKAYTASVAREVTEVGMQVYGGIGQTWEHIAHFFTRRALLDREVLGDANEHLARIADARLGGR
jgi:alkylation response protein AidB-like acyl-CoA dehydrogenase